MSLVVQRAKVIVLTYSKVDYNGYHNHKLVRSINGSQVVYTNCAKHCESAWVAELEDRTSHDGKVRGVNMGSTWVLAAPGGPHVGPTYLAIWPPLLKWFSLNCDVAEHQRRIYVNVAHGWAITLLHFIIVNNSVHATHQRSTLWKALWYHVVLFLVST